MLLEIGFIVSVSFTSFVPNCVQSYENIILAFNRKQYTVFVHNNVAIDIYLDRNPKKKSFKSSYFLDISKRFYPNLQSRPLPQKELGIKINFVYLILFVLTGELKFYSGILGIILCACLHLSFTPNNQSCYC